MSGLDGAWLSFLSACSLQARIPNIHHCRVCTTRHDKTHRIFDVLMKKLSVPGMSGLRLRPSLTAIVCLGLQ